MYSVSESDALFTWILNASVAGSPVAFNRTRSRKFVSAAMVSFTSWDWLQVAALSDPSSFLNLNPSCSIEAADGPQPLLVGDGFGV